MKKLTVIFCLLFLVSLNALAQYQNQYQPRQQKSSVDDKRTFYIKKVEKYRRLRNNGIGFTIVGGVLMGVGISTLSQVTYSTTYYGSSSSSTVTGGHPVTGALELLGGMGCLGAGIPLWVVGGHNVKKYSRKLEMEFNSNYGKRQAGLTFTYHF